METNPVPQVEDDKVISGALSDLAGMISLEQPLAVEVTEPTAEEVAAKKLWPDAVPDPRIAALESEKLQQGINIADLEAQLRVLNEKLTAVRKAKDGYKAIAAQGVKDLAYVKKMVGMVYAERRADEMQKEFEAVKDEN